MLGVTGGVGADRPDIMTPKRLRKVEKGIEKERDKTERGKEERGREEKHKAREVRELREGGERT